MSKILEQEFLTIMKKLEESKDLVTKDTNIKIIEKIKNFQNSSDVVYCRSILLDLEEISSMIQLKKSKQSADKYDIVEVEVPVVQKVVQLVSVDKELTEELIKSNRDKIEKITELYNKNSNQRLPNSEDEQLQLNTQIKKLTLEKNKFKQKLIQCMTNLQTIDKQLDDKKISNGELKKNIMSLKENIKANKKNLMQLYIKWLRYDITIITELCKFNMLKINDKFVESRLYHMHKTLSDLALIYLDTEYQQSIADITKKVNSLFSINNKVSDVKILLNSISKMLEGIEKMNNLNN